MWSVFIQQRRHKIGRRWIFLLLSLASYVAINMARDSLLPDLYQAGRLGEIPATLLSLLTYLPAGCLGLLLLLEAWEALGDFYNPQPGPVLHLTPVSIPTHFGVRLLSALFTGLLALLLLGEGGRLGQLMGWAEGAVPFYSARVLSPVFLVSALLQLAFYLSLLFFIQTLGQLVRGPRKKAIQAFQLPLDYLILAPVAAGLTFAVELVVQILPIVFNFRDFALEEWGKSAWLSTSRLFWTYAGNMATDPSLSQEGLWMIPLVLILFVGILLFTGTCALAEDRVDY